MASFGYEAVDKSGKDLKGSIEADSIEKAKSELKSQGLTVLELTEQNALNKDINIDLGGKPKPRDMSVFCRQFVSMIRAGVSMIDALKMLAEATENKKLREAITDVRVSTEKGESLADSLSEHPNIFPELMINMVAAGEASGSVDKSMERMATQFERSNKTRALVKKAMTYPIVVCVVAICVVIVMLTVVIPSYVEMFEDLDTELPGLTVAVMNMSDFLTTYWYIIIPVVAVAAFLFGTFRKTETGRRLFGKLAITVPKVKDLTIKSASAQMARTLSTLMGAGVPMVEAVSIVAKTMDNLWFRDAVEEVQEAVTIGQPLSQPMQESGLFPPMLYNMIRIGEETGNIEDMLDKAADYYEEEVEMAVQTLMAAMEPMIIVLLAGIVAVLIGACMAPMLTMYDALENL